MKANKTPINKRTQKYEQNNEMVKETPNSNRLQYNFIRQMERKSQVVSTLVVVGK